MVIASYIRQLSFEQKRDVLPCFCVAISLTMVEIASTWCGKNTRPGSRNDRRTYDAAKFPVWIALRVMQPERLCDD
jgi:hypothetical protein